MTETSSKGVLRLTIAMFLSVGLLGMWIGGCGNQTPEQKIERLIEELRDKDWIVRASAAAELGRMGEGTASFASSPIFPNAIAALLRTCEF